MTQTLDHLNQPKKDMPECVQKLRWSTKCDKTEYKRKAVQYVYEDKVTIIWFYLESSGAFTIYVESSVFLFSNLPFFDIVLFLWS